MVPQKTWRDEDMEKWRKLRKKRQTGWLTLFVTANRLFTRAYSSGAQNGFDGVGFGIGFGSSEQLRFPQGLEID